MEAVAKNNNDGIKTDLMLCMFILSPFIIWLLIVCLFLHLSDLEDYCLWIYDDYRMEEDYCC
jgi:hypothetical protein